MYATFCMLVSNFSLTYFMGRSLETCLNTKGHQLEVCGLGYIIGHDCDLFLGQCVFDAMYFVYPFRSHNKCSIK